MTCRPGVPPAPSRKELQSKTQRSRMFQTLILAARIRLNGFPNSTNTMGRGAQALEPFPGPQRADLPSKQQSFQGTVLWPPAGSILCPTNFLLYSHPGPVHQLLSSLPRRDVDTHSFYNLPQVCPPLPPYPPAPPRKWKGGKSSCSLKGGRMVKARLHWKMAIIWPFAYTCHPIRPSVGATGSLWGQS